MSAHRKLIHRLAFADGIALLALVFIAVPVKYMLEQPIGVKILGPIHGTLFLSLAISTIAALVRGALKPSLGAMLMIGALLPLGAFFADSQLRKTYPELR